MFENRTKPWQKQDADHLPEPQDLAPGNDFYKDVVDKNGVTIQQRQLILEANRNAYGGEVQSAQKVGITWPGSPEVPPE